MYKFLLIPSLIFYLFYNFFNIRNQIHMLQLNSYMNNRYLYWVKNNIIKFFNIKYILLLIPITLALVGDTDYSWIAWSIILLVYSFFPPSNQQKKKMVNTPRVKRLILTISLAYILILGILLFYKFDLVIYILSLTVIIILPFTIVIISNTINMPIERAINKYYYSDASRIIKGMPFLKVIGITGSYGKTSTKYILNKILSKRFNTLMTPESYNTTMGVIKTIRDYLKPTHDIFIAEMGAKKIGDIKEICDLVSPSIGILTSIGEQHLESFKKIENIKKAKNQLLESLPQDGIAVINMDDYNIASLPREKNPRYISYGIYSNALDYYANNIKVTKKGTEFRVYKKDGSYADFHTALLGIHNIYNILAGISVASEIGIEMNDMVHQIMDLEPVPHRLQLKKNSFDITIIDDAYNSNPVGSSMALEVLKAMECSKRILVTPGMVELGAKEFELNKKFGNEASSSCDYVILVGKRQTIPIYQGLQEGRFNEENIYKALDLEDAIKQLQKIAVKGSVVLFENDLPDTYNE